MLMFLGEQEQQDIQAARIFTGIGAYSDTLGTPCYL